MFVTVRVTPVGRNTAGRKGHKNRIRRALLVYFMPDVVEMVGSMSGLGPMQT